MRQRFLILFDIDGTLVKHCSIEREGWIVTLRDLFRINRIKDEWSSYISDADSGILKEVFMKELKREITIKEEKLFKDYLANYFKRQIENNPTIFKEVKGARSLFQTLSTMCNSGISIGIVSGNWKDIGLLKLKSIGIETKRFFSAFAEKGPDKNKIFASLLENIENNRYQKIVYIGDTEKDYLNAKYFDLKFIGVNYKSYSNVLLKPHFLKDFKNINFFMKKIQEI